MGSPNGNYNSLLSNILPINFLVHARFLIFQKHLGLWSLKSCSLPLWYSIFNFLNCFCGHVAFPFPCLLCLQLPMWSCCICFSLFIMSSIAYVVMLHFLFLVHDVLNAFVVMLNLLTTPKCDFYDQDILRLMSKHSHMCHLITTILMTIVKIMTTWIYIGLYLGLKVIMIKNMTIQLVFILKQYLYLKWTKKFLNSLI
jgi:hypothetical protein